MERMTATVIFKIRPSELEVVRQRAQAAGLSVSSFIRHKITVLSKAEESQEKDKWTCEVVQGSKHVVPQGVSIAISQAKEGFTFANPIQNMLVR